MPSCFLAYRKANATLRDRLTGAIDALKNDDFPFELWSDNLLLPGSEWERDIAIRIDEADLFFMLVTTEYSANSYSVETELRRAISRAKQNSGIKIIPIIADNIIGFLGKAEIEEFKYNALPSGGKGISHFGDTAAWIEAVVSGVKRLIHEELAGMQLRPLNLAQEIARYRSSITSGLEAVDSCDGSLGRYTSLVRYALMRAYDTLDIGPETFITSLSPIRKKINDARRAARDAKASEIEDILKDIGVSIDDLQDAANYIVDVDVPVVEPVSPLSVGQFGVLQDRTALDARLTWVESASDVLEDFEDQVAEVDGIFLATASRQIGAESRLARTVIQGSEIETNRAQEAVGQLSRTVNSMAEQAPAHLPAAAIEAIGNTKAHTDTAVIYAARLYSRAAGLPIPATPDQFRPEPQQEDAPPANDEITQIDDNVHPIQHMTPSEKRDLAALVSLGEMNMQHMYEIGTLYERGRGVRKDHAIARSFYRHAARNGYGRAWHRLERLDPKEVIPVTK